VDTELVTDVVISEGNGTVSDKFAAVYSANLGSADLPGFNGFTSSHMAVAGRVPAGGSILFLDMHVAWRPFKQMQPWAPWTSSRYFWY
jgi:hypothetical protein